MIDWEGLKAAYEKTTKGKWRDDNGYRVYGPITPMDFDNEYEPLLFETKHTDATGGDSTFCALVHNIFPAILAQHEQDQRAIEALGRFAGEIINRDDGNLYDIDGSDIQDMATKYGLFVEVEATESCGNEMRRCVCAEEADFPTICFRLTDIGKLALAEFNKVVKP